MSVWFGGLHFMSGVFDDREVQIVTSTIATVLSL
jgi:hypothetical protein